MSPAARLLRSATRRILAVAGPTARPSTAAAAHRRGLATLVAPPPSSSSRRVLAAGPLSPSPAVAWPPTHRRATAAFASAAGNNSGLAEALEDEIKYEAENYEAPEGVSAPPAGWDLDESPGDTLVSLTRAGLAPGELVTVELLVDEQGEEDEEAELFGGEDEDEDDDDGEASGGSGSDGEEEDDDFDDSIVFTAAVAKGESALVFECQSDGTYIQVLSVSMEPNPDAPLKEGDEDEDDDIDADETRYAGPLYDELDERLQAEFESYLAARGVTPEFGGWLAAYAGDKEQREYVAWLKKVKAFVES